MSKQKRTTFKYYKNGGLYIETDSTTCVYLDKFAISLLLTGCLSGGGGGSKPAQSYTVTISVKDENEVSLTNVTFFDDYNQKLPAESSSLAGDYKISGLTGTLKIKAVLPGYKFNAPLPVTKAGNLNFEGTRDGVVVNSAQELTSALNDKSINIFLGADLEANITADYLVNLHFEGYTLAGNLDINTGDAGTMILRGPGKVGGDVTVNAHFGSVRNELEVAGTININDIAPNSWDEDYDRNNLVINALNANVHINKGAGAITIKGAHNHLNIALEAVVGELYVDQPLAITGANRIQNAKINSDGVIVDQMPEIVVGTHKDNIKTAHPKLPQAKKFVSSLEPALEIPEWISILEMILEDKEEEDLDEYLEDALDLLLESLYPLLSAKLFKIEPHSSEHDWEAVWIIEKSEDLKITYKTDQLDLLQQLQAQFQNLIKPLGLEKRGNINFAFQVEHEGFIEFEGMLSFKVPVEDGQVNLFELKDIWLDAIYSKDGNKINLQGHLNPVIRNEIIEELSFDGRLELAGVKLHGELMIVLDYHQEEEEIYPKEVTFNGEVNILDLFEVTGRFTAKFEMQLNSNKGYHEQELTNLSLQVTGTGGQVVNAEIGLEVVQVGPHQLETRINISQRINNRNFSWQASVVSINNTEMTTITVNDFKLEHSGYSPIQGEITLNMPFEDGTTTGTLKFYNGDNISAEIIIDSEIQDDDVLGNIYSDQDELLATIRWDDGNIIIKYCDGTTKHLEIDFFSIM